jgi:hypothetical protein
MSTATEVDTSTLSELDFDITCQMAWYWVATKEVASTCDNDATLLVTYTSYIWDVVRVIPMCEFCMNDLKKDQIIEAKPLKGA